MNRISPRETTQESAPKKIRIESSENKQDEVEISGAKTLTKQLINPVNPQYAAKALRTINLNVFAEFLKVPNEKKATTKVQVGSNTFGLKEFIVSLKRELKLLDRNENENKTALAHLQEAMNWLPNDRIKG